MNSRTKNLILGVVAICGIIVLWGLAARPHRDSVTYSHFLQEVRAGEVANAIIVPGAAGTSEATIKLKDATMQRTVFPRDYRDAMVAMQERLVDIEIREFSFATAASQCRTVSAALGDLDPGDARSDTRSQVSVA